MSVSESVQSTHIRPCSEWIRTESGVVWEAIASIVRPPPCPPGSNCLLTMTFRLPDAGTLSYAMKDAPSWITIRGDRASSVLSDRGTGAVQVWSAAPLRARYTTSRAPSSHQTSRRSPDVEIAICELRSDWGL